MHLFGVKVTKISFIRWLIAFATRKKKIRKEARHKRDCIISYQKIWYKKITDSDYSILSTSIYNKSMEL